MYYKEPETDYPFFPGIEMDKGFSYIDNIMSGEPYESLESRLQRQNEARRAASAANSTKKNRIPALESLKADPSSQESKAKERRGNIYEFKQDGYFEDIGNNEAPGRKHIFKGYNGNILKAKRSIMNGFKSESINNVRIGDGKEFDATENTFSSRKKRPIKKLFKFFNENTTPEWVFMEGRNRENGRRNNTMYTWHREEDARFSPMEKFAKNNKVLNMIHSHPNGHGLSEYDTVAAEGLTTNNKNNMSKAKFGIYDRGKKRVFYYDQDGLIPSGRFDKTGNYIIKSKKYFR